MMRRGGRGGSWTSRGTRVNNIYIALEELIDIKFPEKVSSEASTLYINNAMRTLLHASKRERAWMTRESKSRFCWALRRMFSSMVASDTSR